jgi:hypothetical protein
MFEFFELDDKAFPPSMDRIYAGWSYHFSLADCAMFFARSIFCAC